MNFIGVIENEVIGMGTNTIWLLSFEKTEFIYGLDNIVHVNIGMGANTVWPLSFEKSKFRYGIDNTECVKILCEVECKDRGAFSKPKNIKNFQRSIGDENIQDQAGWLSLER